MKQDPTKRTAEQVKVLLSGMAHQYPTSFECPICGALATQNRSITQRNGWPVCCGRTMDDVRL